MNLENEYKKIIKNEDVDSVLRNLEHSPNMKLKKAFILLKSYSVLKDYSFYRRAISELSSLFDETNNSVLNSLSYALEDTDQPELLSYLLTSTKTKEILEFFGKNYFEEWPLNYVGYLFYRINNVDDEALYMLRKACSTNTTLERELSDYYIWLSYYGEIFAFTFSKDFRITNVLTLSSSKTKPPLLKENTFILPNKSILFSVEEFLEFLFLLNSIPIKKRDLGKFIELNK